MPNTPIRHRMALTVNNQIDAIVVTWDDGGRNVSIACSAEWRLGEAAARNAALLGALTKVESLTRECHEVKQARTLKIKQVLRDLKDTNQITGVVEQEVRV